MQSREYWLLTKIETTSSQSHQTHSNWCDTTHLSCGWMSIRSKTKLWLGTAQQKTPSIKHIWIICCICFIIFVNNCIFVKQACLFKISVWDVCLGCLFRMSIQDIYSRCLFGKSVSSLLLIANPKGQIKTIHEVFCILRLNLWKLI